MIRRGKSTIEYAQVLIDLASLPVFPEQSPEHTLAAHPKDLGGHTGLGGTLPLTDTGVTALALRSKEFEGALAGVDGGGLDDDMVVLDELLNVPARVGIANLGLFIGVEPDFTLADASDGGGEPLLGSKVDHLLA